MRRGWAVAVGGGGWEEGGLAIELLEHALHGAGAAAAGHGDVEFVVVVRHC